MNKSGEKIDKGGAAEEALRRYFIDLGAFVIRGVPVRQGGDDITDVDIWAYTRASVHARHIAIVDIKNKKRAKGYERAIWLRGLQSAIKADESMIASTSGREDLRPFAERLGVRLLSRQVFQAVMNRYEGRNDRLSSEEMEAIWKGVRIDGPENLSSRMKRNFEEVGLGISFSALNTWLDDAAFLFNYACDHERVPGAVLRAAMMCAALVAIAADFLGKDLAFADQETRREYFRQGLIFGSADGATGRSYLAFAEKVATDFLDKTGAAASTIRVGFNRAVQNMPVTPFAEFFARPSAGRELVDAAIQLEGMAYGSNEPVITTLPIEAKAVLGLVLDYAGIERKLLMRGASGVSEDKSDFAGQEASESAKPQSDLLL